MQFERNEKHLILITTNYIDHRSIIMWREGAWAGEASFFRRTRGFIKKNCVMKEEEKFRNLLSGEEGNKSENRCLCDRVT